MYKVLIFAGTIEGRSVAEYLAGTGVPVHACVATEYGASLMKGDACLSISDKRLSVEEMTDLMKAEGLELVIDATHPYAAVVSANIKEAAQAAGMDVIRLLRSSEDEAEDYVAVDSVPEAAKYLAETEGNVLITTGSKELKEYTIIPGFADRLYPRFLPAPGAVETASALGYKQKNMICMQGPFSYEINVAMLKMCGAKWLVTKETGKAGGFGDKVKAAKEAGAKLVVVGRPTKETGLSEEEVKDLLRARFDLGIFAPNMVNESATEAPCSCPEAAKETPAKRQVTLIGIGMGTTGGMTVEALKDCEEADVVLGATRMVECVAHLGKPQFISYKDQELKGFLDENPQYQKAVILLSGDIGFYSGAKKLIACLEDGYEVKTRPGISSVVYFCGKLKTSWEDVKLMSLHGKNQNLIAAVANHKKVFALVGGKEAVGEICSQLTEYNLGHVTINVGIKLSYEDEEIISGKASELAGKPIGGLCVILVENATAGSRPVTHGIEDEEFLRAKAPMTKSEVRMISLSKLRLNKDSIIYDVGAGTGSISIEAALQAPDGFVYAIEKKEDACALIEENKHKFQAANIEVVSGLAPEALEPLPAPTHAFIGGSSGNMKEIIQCLLEKNPKVRIVINTIALESVAETLDCMKTLPVTDVDIIHISSARSRELGRYHMMTGMNPIYIVSCTGNLEV